MKYQELKRTGKISIIKRNNDKRNGRRDREEDRERGEM